MMKSSRQMFMAGALLGWAHGAAAQTAAEVIEKHLAAPGGRAALAVPGTGRLDPTTDFAEQRDVDGVKVPFLLKPSSAAQSFTVAVTKVEHNVTVDAKLFVKPGGDR